MQSRLRLAPWFSLVVPLTTKFVSRMWRMLHTFHHCRLGAL